MIPLENQINAISQGKLDITTNMTTILSGLTGLESKIKDIEGSQEKIKIKIAGFEEEIQKFNATPEIKVEPVMPIKRDKAMAALTDTEIAVLEMLSSEGPKTAPEIKDRVHLSREHTARLMKKIYEEGYVEREEGKIPFRYSIKKEMEKLLRKPESSQPI
jgi:DNA-binding MarR family transcriptional regulator